MSKYAVALISHIAGTELQLCIVKADDWQSALEGAFPGWLESVESDVLENAQEEASDQDWEFNVRKIEGI